ncbi:MAG: hypothetical protein ABSC64_21365 [Candidatus Korobacteraceae bacterium]|jgi:hypothetical protein
MKRGDKVRVAVLAHEPEFRGRFGTVLADSAPGEMVKVEFEEEAIRHNFLARELERAVE